MKEIQPPAAELGAGGQSVPLEDLPRKISEEQSVPPSGKRQAFRDIRRQLTDEDLKSVGVQKLILDELERSEAQCEVLQSYVELYHEADKRAAVLQTEARTDRSLEVAFGVGVSLGGAIIGLTPFFWNNRLQGIVALLLGICLIVGSTVARVLRR